MVGQVHLSGSEEQEVNSGYYAACAGLAARSQALEVIANNLANINTNGYRGQQPTFRALLAAADIGNPLSRAVNNFNVLSGTRLDLNPGNLERTGGQFDLAIEGNGFFAVQTGAGMMYTRNGSFRLSATNQLITAAGDPVLGEQGPLIMPNGAVSISADGTVSVNGAVAGKVRLVEFSPEAQLTPTGNSYYDALGAKPVVAARAAVRQGMLEASNVNPISATVSLISVQRNAEMLQRALGAFYGEFNRIAANDLPRI